MLVVLKTVNNNLCTDDSFSDHVVPIAIEGSSTMALGCTRIKGQQKKYLNYGRTSGKIFNLIQLRKKSVRIRENISAEENDYNM